MTRIQQAVGFHPIFHQCPILLGLLASKKINMHVVTVASVRAVSNLKNLIAKYAEPLYMQESNPLGPML
jgi:hypothetical protein